MSIHVPTMVWAIINFLILVAILNKFLYGPIVKILDDRKNEVVNNLDQAETAKTEAEKLKEEYVEQIKKAKLEAQEIINKANKLGEETKNEIISEARDEAAKVSAKAQAQIQREKSKALAELRDEVASLAILAAEKVVAKSLNNQDHEKMVHEFVKEVGEAQ